MDMSFDWDGIRILSCLEQGAGLGHLWGHFQTYDSIFYVFSFSPDEFEKKSTIHRKNNKQQYIGRQRSLQEQTAGQGSLQRSSMKPCVLKDLPTKKTTGLKHFLPAHHCALPWTLWFLLDFAVFNLIYIKKVW